jgi:hypothetical protein
LSIAESRLDECRRGVSPTFRRAHPDIHAWIVPQRVEDGPHDHEVRRYSTVEYHLASCHAPADGVINCM